METRAISTKWIVEIYPFESTTPSALDFVGSRSKKGPSVVSSKISKDVFSETVSLTLPEGYELKSYGITNVGISRSKADAAGECSLSITGPLPQDMIPGSWIIVSTVSIDSEGQTKTLMRFIGQICVLDVTYGVEGNGLKTIQSTLRAREWSSCYKTPVRYDLMSFEVQVIKPDAFNAAVVASASLGQSKNFTTSLSDLVSQSFDPFDMGRVILQLVGAVNQGDLKIDTTPEHVKQLPGLAVTMPSIPKAILERLGFDDADPKNPFSSGFVKTIIGNQLEAIYNDGSWNGIWGSPSQALPLSGLSAVMQDYGSQNPQNRPKISGIGAMLQNGWSAWDMLNNFCENTLNEVFTDIWYEKGPDNTIVGKPVLVLRDKPFLIKSLRDDPPSELGKVPDLEGWTLYDDLPRLLIPSVNILNLRINNNILNSPNYIRADYQTPTGTRYPDAAAALAGIVRLSSEMERFGGKAESVNVTFFGLNPSDASSKGVPTPSILPSSFETYFGIAKSLYTLWHAYDYKMANGFLVLQDDNLPISIGINLQFQIGKYTLVGHVERVEYQYSINQDNGLEETITHVTLSRICKVEKDGSVGFIPPEDFGNLYHAEPTAADTASSKKLKKISALIPDFGFV